MGSPNGGGSNNFGSFAGVITALNETNKRLRTLTDLFCAHSINQTIASKPSGVTILTYSPITNWDFSKHSTEAQLTLLGNTTLNMSNMLAGQFYLLEVFQDSSGGHSITPPAGSKVVNNGSGIISLSSAPFSIDILSLYYNGTTVYIMVNKSFT